MVFPPCTDTDKCTDEMKASTEKVQERLAGTYVKQVEDREDTMEALSAGCNLISLCTG